MDRAGEAVPSTFKKCPLCGHHWAQQDEFLADPAVRLVGYMANFYELDAGQFLFNHEVRSCGTTLSLPGAAFTTLYQGPRFATRLTGTAECPGYCLAKDDLRPCPARCECAYVREVIRAILAWPKSLPPC